MVAEPVDQPGKGNGLDLERLCQLGLHLALDAIEAHQNRPLRARHAMRARTLVDVGAHRVGDVGQLHEDKAGIGAILMHRLIISMLIKRA